MRRLYTYVVEHDLGFAPNPFQGVCTLATCKPDIRQTAKVGDYVTGLGGADNGLHGRLVYFMEVAKDTNYDEYWLDPQFCAKRPMLKGSNMQCYGDNIYHRDRHTKRWLQENSFHSRKTGVHLENLQHDTRKTSRVLIGHRFAYWGGDGPVIPKRFRNFDGRDVCGRRAHQCTFSPEMVEEFVKWLHSLDAQGVLGRPANW